MFSDTAQSKALCLQGGTGSFASLRHFFIGALIGSEILLFTPDLPGGLTFDLFF